MYQIINLVEFIHNSIHQHHLSNINSQHHPLWSKPLVGELKINIGRAHSTSNGASVCGGIIHDLNGSFITYFYSEVSFSIYVFVEMWALQSGIWLARDLHI